MEDKKLLLWYSDARSSAGHPLSLVSPCCVPWGVCSPFLLLNALSPVLCLQESFLFPKRVETSWETPKLCSAKCRGELTGAFCSGVLVALGRGQCVVAVPVHPPWSWLLSLQLFITLGSEGLPPPAPNLSTASQAHLEPLAAPFLAVGALSKPS